MLVNTMTKNLKTPDRKGIKFPDGYLLINEKWGRNALGRSISQRNKVVYSDALNFVDFYIKEDCPVLYFSESDLKINFKECKVKISKLNGVVKEKGIVIVDWNSKILIEFSDIQEYASLDNELFVIPVSSQSELPDVLHKLVMFETKSPQKEKKGFKFNLSLKDQISQLKKISGIGDKEANKLLQQFGNLFSVCEASKAALKSTLGERLAFQVWKFFNEPIS